MIGGCPFCSVHRFIRANSAWRYTKGRECFSGNLPAFIKGLVSLVSGRKTAYSYQAVCEKCDRVQEGDTARPRSEDSEKWNQPMLQRGGKQGEARWIRSYQMSCSAACVVTVRFLMFASQSNQEHNLRQRRCTTRIQKDMANRFRLNSTHYQVASRLLFRTNRQL
jgi:hypothetical protein